MEHYAVSLNLGDVFLNILVIEGVERGVLQLAVLVLMM